MSDFNNAHGARSISDREDLVRAKKGTEWSSQRVAIGSELERDLLALNEYRAILRILGIDQLLTEAKSALPFGATPEEIAQHLLSARGFSWEAGDTGAKENAAE